MKSHEQEKYFAELKAKFPHWKPEFISGWVHGAVDETQRNQPESGYIRRAKKKDAYANGYLFAFALHRGVDAENEPWFEFVPRIEVLK